MSGRTQQVAGGRRPRPSGHSQAQIHSASGIPRVWRDKGAIFLSSLKGSRCLWGGMQYLFNRVAGDRLQRLGRSTPYLIENPRGTLGGSLVITQIEAGPAGLVLPPSL